MEWTSIYKTGIEVIDSQHKILFDVITKLKKIPRGNNSKEEIIKVVKFIEKYAVIHFSTEEKLLKENNFSDFENHKNIHNNFIKEFLKIKNRVETSDDYDHLEIFLFLIKWLQTHIAVEDKKYVSSIKNDKISTK